MCTVASCTLCLLYACWLLDDVISCPVRVWWRAGRMTAGTVVITGGILATVILLCIIAVLCYCRLQVGLLHVNLYCTYVFVCTVCLCLYIQVCVEFVCKAFTLKYCTVCLYRNICLVFPQLPNICDLLPLSHMRTSPSSTEWVLVLGFQWWLRLMYTPHFELGILSQIYTFSPNLQNHQTILEPQGPPGLPLATLPSSLEPN